MKIADTDTFR